MALVGRRRELDRLTRLLDRAARGTGGHVIVTGPAGVGKTALADATAALARARGLPVFRAAAVAGDSGWGIWNQLLRDLDVDELSAHPTPEDLDLAVRSIAGHSIGGVLATMYAARYPVRGVVNLDQPLLVGAFGGVLRNAEPVLRGPDYRQVWDSMLVRMRVDLLPPAARELVQTASTPRQDLLLGYWAEILTRSDEELAQGRVRDLTAIRASGVPYHYVTATEPDPAYQRWLEATLPDVRVTVLPGSGHFPHLAQPAAVARIAATVNG